MRTNYTTKRFITVFFKNIYDTPVQLDRIQFFPGVQKVMSGEKKIGYMKTNEKRLGGGSGKLASLTQVSSSNYHSRAL